LIAWLEGVQPPFESQGKLIPTFGLKLILDEIHAATATSDFKTAAVKLIERAVQVEQSHALRAIEALIDRTEEGLDTQIAERSDALDAYFDGLRDSEETIRPQKAAEELSSLIHLPLRLTGEQSRLFTEDTDEFKKWLEEYLESQLISLNTGRVAGAIEHRLGESLGGRIEAANWNEAAEMITSRSRDLLGRQRERLTSQVERDLETLLQRETGEDDSSKLRLLMSLSQGARTVFDGRTHRQVKQIFNRFSYIYLAAQLLENRNADEVTEAVLEHLDQAESELQMAWGQGEFTRLSQNAARLADFGPAAQVLGEDRLNEPPSALSDEDRDTLIRAIGAYVLNEVKRQLLLSAISELWVDYLTKVEALRVSIGLEAYAQRDPLVQYKGQASELFQQLLEDVRGAVIGRVFAYQPRRIEITPVEATPAAASTPAETQPAVSGQGQSVQAGGGKKKRRRH
jgi:preprotein translocase subunit SecA